MIVSRETFTRLETYKRLVKQWNPRINLVAAADVEELQARHIDDCMQVADMTAAESGRWADLGSGGGLPGIVMAIVKADTGLSFVLIESDQRKAAFLRTVVRETGLGNTTVISQRIEALPPLDAAFVSARALAPLTKLMAYLDRHLAPGGKAFLMKGRQWRSEVEDARTEWRFGCMVHPSVTQDGAAILEISGVSHGAA